VEQQFVIGVHDVPEHQGAWTFTVARAWLADALKGCELEATDEDGRLEVEVTRAGNEFLVRGRVHVITAATCGRCLRPTPVVIDTPILVLYVPGPAVEKLQDDDEEPAPDEGPDVEHFQGDSLVLDGYVRDTILLEVPMNPKCQVDCRLPERPQGVS
jgi:uncharacterized metal-binding protein YceD (DUF177 family)